MSTFISPSTSDDSVRSQDKDLLELAAATEVNDEQARMLRDGMELLVEYLGTAREGWDDEDAPIH